MNGSRKIQVLKRDGAVAPFSPDQLRLCLWRAMAAHRGQFAQAGHLAEAIVLYLVGVKAPAITSRALLEMALQALRQTNHAAAADALETHHRWRLAARRRLTVLHRADRRSEWNRQWLTEQAQRRWDLSRAVARALSAQIEAELLGEGGEVRRQKVLDLLDERVENYGLAPWCLMASAPRV